MLLAKAIEERYGHYASVLGVRRRAVSQLEIQVGSADEESPEANLDADLVRRWTERPEMVDEIDAMLDAVAIGFSVSEIAWETSERDWWPARLAWVHPAYLRLDETRTQLRLRDGASPGGEPLAPGKFVELHLRASTQLPMRTGATRLVAWFWLFGAYGLMGWIRLAEIHGLPIRLGRYHANASEADRRKLLRAASRIGRDAAAVIPDTMSLELLDHKGAAAGGDLHLKLQQYMDHSTSKVVLGQTTTTDAISGGHAVSREHELVREDIQRADARAVAAALERIGRLLVELNHGPREAYPSLRLSARDQFDTDKQNLGDPARRAQPACGSPTEAHSSSSAWSRRRTTTTCWCRSRASAVAAEKKAAKASALPRPPAAQLGRSASPPRRGPRRSARCHRRLARRRGLGAHAGPDDRAAAGRCTRGPELHRAAEAPGRGRGPDGRRGAPGRPGPRRLRRRGRDPA